MANQCLGYEIWFEVTNNTPFELTQDRAEFEFTFEGVTGTTSQFIRKITLSSGQHKSFVIKGDLTDYRAQQIADLHTQYESSITVNALYQCKVREFTFHRNLDGIKPDIINIASRTQQNNHTVKRERFYRTETFSIRGRRPLQNGCPALRRRSHDSLW
ncbi:hypothetical protein [Neptunicella sp. SCSIO 80796]|uniref:hypothetical protein n=1 Tax=Neptunicella plasticusilytica TaxID=3117012 RepID=UPI003A4DEC11